MRQWYPLSGNAHPGPEWEWEWETTVPPVAGDHRYAWGGPDLVEATQAFPALADYGTQTRYGVPAPRQESAPPAFSQQFCEVSRVDANGNLQPGLPGVDFLVRIVGGWLTVIEIPVIPVFSVPADEVQIITPLWQRKIGTGSVLRVAGQFWSVQFVRVYQAEIARADRGRLVAEDVHRGHRAEGRPLRPGGQRAVHRRPACRRRGQRGRIAR